MEVAKAYFMEKNKEWHPCSEAMFHKVCDEAGIDVKDVEDLQVLQNKKGVRFTCVITPISDYTLQQLVDLL